MALILNAPPQLPVRRGRRTGEEHKQGIDEHTVDARIGDRAFTDDDDARRSGLQDGQPPLGKTGPAWSLACGVGEGEWVLTDLAQ